MKHIVSSKEVGLGNASAGIGIGIVSKRAAETRAVRVILPIEVSGIPYPPNCSSCRRQIQ
jgi:hypothetical protein